jgi:hypothetical protein
MKTNTYSPHPASLSAMPGQGGAEIAEIKYLKPIGRRRLVSRITIKEVLEILDSLLRGNDGGDY